MVETSIGIGDRQQFRLRRIGDLIDLAELLGLQRQQAQTLEIQIRQIPQPVWAVLIGPFGAQHGQTGMGASRMLIRMQLVGLVQRLLGRVVLAVGPEGEADYGNARSGYTITVRMYVRSP